MEEGAMAMTYAIEDWTQRLGAVPQTEFTLTNVESFVRGHRIEAVSLEPYLYWSKASYTRNLIYKCELFEVMAICWEVGQASRIHNHRDQNCWMATPIGRLKVQNFRVEKKDPSNGACRIEASDSYVMDAANPGVVRPDAPVHQVLNPEEFAQRAASIHIYSRPYASCEIYSLERGTYMDVPLHFTSEYGRLSPDEKLA
jgi:cysteine dioxygenase